MEFLPVSDVYLPACEQQLSRCNAKPLISLAFPFILKVYQKTLITDQKVVDSISVGNVRKKVDCYVINKDCTYLVCILFSSMNEYIYVQKWKIPPEADHKCTPGYNKTNCAKCTKKQEMITALNQKLKNVLTVKGSENIIETTKLSELTKSNIDSEVACILCNVTTNKYSG